MAKADAAAAGLRPLYSFDQLVIGGNNKVAAAACREVAKSPGQTYNPLFIYGPSGVGKTHLMQAVAHLVLEKGVDSKIRYISAERFMSDIMTAVTEDRVMDVRQVYSDLDLLIIDDVQYLTESKIAQEELFHIFNNMHEKNHQLILAADRPPNQLTALHKNVKSRLEWGLSTDVQVPDLEMRVEILRKKQALQGLEIPDELLVFVAHNLRSNVRELEGFLKRVHAYVMLSHQSLTADMVISIVREILPEGGQISAPPNGGPRIDAAKPEPRGAPARSEELGKAADKDKTVEKAVEKAPEKKSESKPHEKPEGKPQENGRTNGHRAKAAPDSVPERSHVDDAADESPFGDIRAPEEVLISPNGNGASFDLLLNSIDIEMPPEAPAAPPPAAKETVSPRATVPAAAKPVVDAPPAPPAPEPVPAVGAVDVTIPQAPESMEDEMPLGHKEVMAVFFYPEGKEEALESVHQKFQDVIKKHKLKFRLKRVHNESYAFKGKINYSSFVDVCKKNGVPVAVVIGPPPDTFIPEQDFYDLLTVTLDVQGVSLQLVNWAEINKDYRYLNLALDIALVRTR